MRNNTTQWPNGKPPEIVHEFVDWLLLPEASRQPRTRAAWADEHGYDRSTVYGWEKDDRVRWLIRDKADELNMGPERVQQVMNALYARAAGGDVQAAKLYMEHVDKILPRDRRQVTSASELTDEQLLAEAERFGLVPKEQ